MPTDHKLVMQYVNESPYWGDLAAPQGVGETTEPGCKDVMRFTIRTRREIITEIGCFVTESACYPVKACAAVAASLAKGKPVMEAYLITTEKISGKLGGLDREHVHCAYMAELTLKRAILDYAKKREGRTMPMTGTVAPAGG